VKLTCGAECWRHSPTSACLSTVRSACLSTCRWTQKIACWSLTAGIIAFYCWAVNYNYNACSSTPAPRWSRGNRSSALTTISGHNSTLYTAAAPTDGCHGLTSSQRSIFAEWLTHHRSGFTYIVVLLDSSLTLSNYLTNSEWHYYSLHISQPLQLM